MPPKAKKKRASLKLDTETGQIESASAAPDPVEEEKELPPPRQVVEVVEEDDVVPDAIETIKKDAEEIEEAVEEIEERVEEEQEAEERERDADDAPVMHEETIPDSRSNVESLFVKSEPGVSPEITVVGKKGTSLGVWVGAMLGVALAIGVSLVLLVRGPSTLSFMAPKPTPTPAPTAAPTPTPAAAVNRKDVKVRVLNGGGTPGAGSKMKTFLEGKGYTVVSVGNAADYSYEQTEVLVKSGKDDFRALLTDDLKADYSLGTSSATVEEDEEYDAEVIVGKEE